MRKLASVAVLVACSALGGCFFFYIPGSAVSGVSDSFQGLEGQHCVGENAHIGDKLKNPDGSIGTVKKLEGYSGRCTQPGRPVRALVTLD